MHLRTLAHCVLVSNFTFPTLLYCIRRSFTLCSLCYLSSPLVRRSNMRTQKTQLYVIRLTAGHYFQEK